MNEIKTSLGFPLVKSEDVWEIDLAGLKIFTGLSVLSTIIGEHIIEQVENNPGDVSFLYKINPHINPELIAMNVFYIQVYARAGVLKNILLFKDEFQDQLITVFGTLQRSNWGKKIYPEFYVEDPGISTSYALIFPFHRHSENDDIDYQFIFERVENCSTQGEYFFRLSIETYQKAALDLKAIPHVIIDDLETRVYISGSTKMAESIRDEILNACNRGIKYYSRENRPYSHLFEQLEKTQLGRMEQINFYWEKDFTEYIQHEDLVIRLAIFKKLLLSLEDGSLCNILNNGGTVKIKVDKIYFSLYLSQLARVLNISINLPRKIFHLDYYLKRMPEVESLAMQQGHDLDFTNTKIFLIHHITSDSIAFIEALKKLEVDSLCVLFVKYGGVVPSVYLDALLENSPKFLFMAGLSRKMTEKNKDYYTLAKYFSDISSLSELNEVMEKEKLNYFEAMKLAAGHIFLKFCIASMKENKKVLLIEDGGYLSPFLNDYALKERTTEEVFKIYHVDNTSEKNSFSNWLKKVMVGSVEHTKNGYDRLNLIKDKYSRLFLPAYSIAVSTIKTTEEAKEVAHSILSAIESILHEHGMVLSQRKVMVLGADGTIGRYLCRYFIGGRLHETNKDLLQVDINYDNTLEYRYATINDIPDELLCTRDLFIGLIGDSVLKRHHIEKIILYGKKTKLFFASGSTKTVEFKDLSNWLYEAFSMEAPKIGNIPLQIEYDRIYDPQTGIDQGGKVNIRFHLNGKHIEKELYLLSDLSPVNFLFYGVPTETMDMVLSQLLKVSLGMNRQSRGSRLPPPDLYAVDKQIDEWGNLL